MLMIIFQLHLKTFSKKQKNNDVRISFYFILLKFKRNSTEFLGNLEPFFKALKVIFFV